MARPLLRRDRHRIQVTRLLQRHSVVAILGPRQSGKTTLARLVAEPWEGSVTFFDLEDPDDLARLSEPKLALGQLEGLVVLDEVQRRPELFPVLRVLVDRPTSNARFLLLGSASPDLLRQSSETLAGRIVYHDLGGLDLEEVGMDSRARLWLRGGFPRSYLAQSDAESAEWRRAFVRTFLERDIPQLGIGIPATTLDRFWHMLAHYHAQVWNGAELGRALGVSAMSVRRYLNVLTGALVVHELPPWHENLAKRQVKSPKLYIADTGLLHTLLGIEAREDLERHPKIGASFEGFVLRELLRQLGARPEECYFWATHAGAELDLLVVRGTTRRGFEIKRTSTPSTTRSQRAALESLGLPTLEVIHAGEHSYPLDPRIRAVGFERLHEDIAPL